LRKGCFAGAAVLALGLLIVIVVGGTFFVQSLTTEPEEKQLTQPIPATDPAPGKIVLSLSSAAVTVQAGPAGGPIRVESNFDPDVHSLEQSYEEDDAGGWTYRLDFHENSLLHVSVVSVWLGKRAPEVTIEIPSDLPFDLEANMEGGYLALELAGLEVSTAGVELDRGVLWLRVSEPLYKPMEQLNVKGRMGAMVLRSLGNASPKELNVQHGIGASLVDLGGMWLRDADIDYRVTFGDGELQLPDGIDVELLDGTPPRLLRPHDQELRKPTLRISTHHDMGDIHIVD
jgi:hypothetical protein